MNITLTAANAVSIASLINYADTSRTPIPETLGTIGVMIRDGQLTAMATDRYVAARYQTNLDIDTGRPGEFRMSAAAARWILANIKKGNKWHNPAPVSLAIEGDSLTIETNGMAYSSQLVTGSQPNLEGLNKLFSEWQPADKAQPLALAGRFLAKVNKLLEDFARVEYATYELGLNITGIDKAGPVRGTAGAFEILIQPRLIPNN